MTSVLSQTKPNFSWVSGGHPGMCTLFPGRLSPSPMKMGAFSGDKGSAISLIKGPPKFCPGAAFLTQLYHLIWGLGFFWWGNHFCSWLYAEFPFSHHPISCLVEVLVFGFLCCLGFFKGPHWSFESSSLRHYIFSTWKQSTFSRSTLHNWCCHHSLPVTLWRMIKSFSSHAPVIYHCAPLSWSEFSVSCQFHLLLFERLNYQPGKNVAVTLALADVLVTTVPPLWPGAGFRHSGPWSWTWRHTSPSPSTSGPGVLSPQGGAWERKVGKHGCFPRAGLAICWKQRSGECQASNLRSSTHWLCDLGQVT